ncbi:MAG TPA: hypothetical protein VEI97_07545 [bacterium]|nr:hypothetical protein [bacterium]
MSEEASRRLAAVKAWCLEKSRGNVHTMSPVVLLWELTCLLDGLSVPVAAARQDLCPTPWGVPAGSLVT